MVKFEKGELTREAYNVIMRDIELLKDYRVDSEDFNYYHKLVVDNIKDIFGLNEYEIMDDDELIDEYTQLNEMIYKVECYSVNDLIRFNCVCNEMIKRGIDDE